MGSTLGARISCRPINKNSQHEAQEKRSIFITLDGTHGADFDKLLAKLQQACEQEGIAFACDSTFDYVKPEAELRAEMAPYLTDNRAFGYKATDVRPIQYFQQDARPALNKMRLNLTRCAAYTSCTDPALRASRPDPDLRFYADYSRENQRRRPAYGRFGLGRSFDKVETYKNCLFLEWPVWETYRRDWLAHHTHAQHSDNQAYYMDLNRPEEPVSRLPPWQTYCTKQVGAVSGQAFLPREYGAVNILRNYAVFPANGPTAPGALSLSLPRTRFARVQDITFEVPFTLLMEARLKRLWERVMSGYSATTSRSGLIIWIRCRAASCRFRCIRAGICRVAVQ